MYYVAGRRIKPLRIILIVLGTFIILLILKRLKNTNNDSYLPVDLIDFGDHHDTIDKILANKKVLINKDKGKNDVVDLDLSYEDDPITPEFLKKLDKKVGRSCPDYLEYSKKKHAPFSKGPFQYPFMRPAPKCRTFSSPAVERVIVDLKSKVKSIDLARLVENCLPNTLDTTILWKKLNAEKDPYEAFVITGDIHAEWLRDAARQLSVYQPFIKHDPELQKLFLGAINTQALYINISPYCNAFHPPPGSGVKHGDTAVDLVFPRPDWRVVFECKWELDSLASFLTLTNEYYINSGGDLSFLNERWINAFEKILIVLRRESQPSFDQKTGQANRFYYSFQRQTNIGLETLALGGVGNPVNFGTGLIRSAFRPSDDATILQFFIPANAQMVTELKRLRKNFFNKEKLKISEEDSKKLASLENLFDIADEFIEGIERGIAEYGIVDHPKWGKVYAYEVDGYGGTVLMDDANIPSLLSLPDMGYIKDFKNDEVYQNTRKMILSKDGNPYFLKGKYFEGIGGPHIGILNAWPMSLLMRMRTTDDDQEILDCLKYIMDTTAHMGLMHESVNVNSADGMDFTRPWFAWCNSEFGKTILHLAKHKPHLIFKEEFADTPYDIDKLLN